MDGAQVPVAFFEVTNLTMPPLSILPECIRPGLCSFSSDLVITVTEAAQSQLAVIDITDGVNGRRLQVAADAATMSSGSRILALKSGLVLQLFDLETKARIGSCETPSPVLYWRWVSVDVLAFVTAAAVFHWTAVEGGEPEVAFERDPELGAGTQIINYQTSDDLRWLLLCTIRAGAVPGTVDGGMQLYSVDSAMSRILEGHTGTFTVLHLAGRPDPAQVLVFQEKKADQPARLCVTELGRSPTAPGGIFRVPAQVIPAAAEAPDDFPVALNVSQQQGVVYMLTKAGYLYLFDVFSAKPMFRARITPDTVFTTADHAASGGVLAITRKGQVLLLGIHPDALVDYVSSHLGDQELASDLASRLCAAHYNDANTSQLTADDYPPYDSAEYVHPDSTWDSTQTHAPTVPQIPAFTAQDELHEHEEPQQSRVPLASADFATDAGAATAQWEDTPALPAAGSISSAFSEFAPAEPDSSELFAAPATPPKNPPGQPVRTPSTRIPAEEGFAVETAMVGGSSWEAAPAPSAGGFSDFAPTDTTWETATLPPVPPAAFASPQQSAVSPFPAPAASSGWDSFPAPSSSGFSEFAPTGTAWENTSAVAPAVASPTPPSARKPISSPFPMPSAAVPSASSGWDDFPAPTAASGLSEYAPTETAWEAPTLPPVAPAAAAPVTPAKPAPDSFPVPASTSGGWDSFPAPAPAPAAGAAAGGFSEFAATDSSWASSTAFSASVPLTRAVSIKPAAAAFASPPPSAATPLKRDDSSVSSSRQGTAVTAQEPPPTPQSPLLQTRSRAASQALTAADAVIWARTAIQQGRAQLLQQRIAEDKVPLSEELGDLLLTVNVAAALHVYSKVGAHDKVATCHFEQRQYDRLVSYAASNACWVDYTAWLQQLLAQGDTTAAVELATKLAMTSNGVPLLDIGTGIDVFMKENLLKECNAFLLEVLKFDLPEEGKYQTQLLEMNILGGYPQVSVAILESNMFSHYDKAHVGSLFERAGPSLLLQQPPSSPQRQQQTQQQQQQQQQQLAQVPPYVQEFAEQTSLVLHQARNLSVLLAWQARRDAARAAYLAAKEAMPRDFLQIADLGKQRDLVQAEALMLPLTEEDYLTLPQRRGALMQSLEAQCEAATAEERFEELRCLAVLLKQLQGMDEIPAPPGDSYVACGTLTWDAEACVDTVVPADADAGLHWDE